MPKATAGGCLIFTLPNVNPTELKGSRPAALLAKAIKIDPNMLRFIDLQIPENFVKMLITAQHEHQSFISFSEQNIFTTSKIISWVASTHPVVIVPTMATEGLSTTEPKPLPFGYEFFYLSCSPAVYQDLTEVFST